METKEKVIIFLALIVLVIAGTATLNSQINHGSPVAAFGGGSLSARTAMQPPAQTRIGFTTVGLNLRPEPNLDNTPITVLPAGSRVRILSVTDGWAKVIDYRNREGYVSNEYLRY